MNREEYIKRAYNALAIKVSGAVEDQHDDMWQLIEDYIKAAIEEVYDVGKEDGYNSGYKEGYKQGYFDGANDQYND